jgi:hypothetical protein
MSLLHVTSCCLLLLIAQPLLAADVTVSIRTDFPGGNVTVLKNDGPTVELAPDLRGGMPWFYWHFEAQASRPGRVTFAFDGQPRIGVRGPAVSVDGGKSWQWLGTERVEYAAANQPPGTKPRETFSYDFAAEQLNVRFAVAIPYLQHDLDQFLKTQAGNAHLKQLPLTKTRRGAPVELLQIGEPGPNVKAFVVTARHHACESMASFVLEGFLRAAMSDSPEGVEFRKRYVLYAVPIVDKDGVQAGDQGKNRAPHDHNRDYGPMPMYPEIRAIQELAEAQQVQYALDFHCPALRGDVHEAFHFLGLGVPHVSDNLNEFLAWIKEERPQAVMTPLNFLTSITKPNAIDRRINSHYFALREGAIFAATLEVPYTQPKLALDAAMARAYGESLLKAWNRTAFITSEPDSNRGAKSHANLAALRAKFMPLHRGKPVEAEALLKEYLTADAAPLYRAEANSLMSLMRFFQKQYADGLRHCDAVLANSAATTFQRDTAVLQRLQIIAADGASTPSQLDAALQAFLTIPYAAADQRAKAFETASQFYFAHQKYVRAIEHAQSQLKHAALYEQGKVLNRIASYYDLLEQPGQSLATRKQAVEFLHTQLTPKPPRSVFGASMTIDLFEALSNMPSATLAERRAAAEMVLEHEIVTAAQKQKVRDTLAKWEQP